MKKSKEPDEQEKELHRQAEEEAVENTRLLLETVLKNLPNMNDYSKAYFKQTYGESIDKFTRRMASAIRWYQSHGYFDEKQKKPEFPASNPPKTFVYNYLSMGTSPSMEKDLGIMIQIQVQNSRDTEQAVRAYHDRLAYCLYAHYAQEDIVRDQQIHRDIQEAKKKKRLADKAHAEAQKRYVERNIERLGEEGAKRYVEDKEKYREKRRRELEEAKKRSIEEFERGLKHGRKT